MRNEACRVVWREAEEFADRGCSNRRQRSICNLSGTFKCQLRFRFNPTTLVENVKGHLIIVLMKRFWLLRFS